MQYIQIAIDGPAGAGKSTIAKKIADILNITYIDTGAMYRALTYKVLQSGIDINGTEKKEIIELATNTDIKFIEENIVLDGKIVNEAIRSREVTTKVSYIAQIPEVREILVGLQKKIAINNNVIMDGRDIGTHVLPEATYKFFLTATIEERAKRRYEELISKGNRVNLKDIEAEIAKRDKIDSERECAPLVAAKDAIIVDTTDKPIDAVVSELIDLLKGD